jgi:hypothetical protein
VSGERVLLVCALAEASLGDHDEARRLERRADEFGGQGYGRSLSAPRLRLALLRNDKDAAKSLVADGSPR